MESPNTQYPPHFSLNTENKKEIAKQIRVALEEHGCMVLKCEEREYFSEEMMEAMDNFFALDTETKFKYARVEPYYRTFIPAPCFQGMSLVNGKAINEEVEKFTRLMWPEGNKKFCRTLTWTNKGLLELAQTIMDIVVTSYGLDNEAMSKFMNANSVCRMWKYMPLKKGEAAEGLPEHVDGSYITILCQNDVDGLKVKSKDGNWFDLKLEKGSYLVFVGSLLKAWSNGRLMAPLHKVMIGEEKDRYSFAFGLVPEEDEVVEVQAQLVDHENPIRFKPFIYKDFLIHTLTSNGDEEAFERFAGI